MMIHIPMDYFKSLSRIFNSNRLYWLFRNYVAQCEGRGCSRPPEVKQIRKIATYNTSTKIRQCIIFRLQILSETSLLHSKVLLKPEHILNFVHLAGSYFSKKMAPRNKKMFLDDLLCAS